MQKARLRRSTRFQAIRTQGRWWTHHLMAVGVLGNSLGYSRCGFSVGKRIGNAVMRNRVRRRLREAVRLQWADVAPGWDIVFAARQPLTTATFSAIQLAISTLLRRAAVVRPTDEGGGAGPC